MGGVSERIGIASEGPRPTTESCREALERLLRDPNFAATDRDKKFLAYVVEESLAGRADRIKAYSVAVEVFGRDATFDPQTDPIVRVQAGHLRRAIDRYYQGPGLSETVVISIPKGGYAPNFTLRLRPEGGEPDPPAPMVATAPEDRARTSFVSIKAALLAVAVIAAISGAWFAARLGVRTISASPDIPRVLVQPLESSGSVASEPIARGLTHEIVGQLAKFKDIVVIEPDARSGAPSGGATGPSPSPRYALAGAIDVAENSLRLQMRLLDALDGRVLWADSYYTDPKAAELQKVESELAGKVASVLAQPYGVIFHADATRHVDTPPDDWEAYSCTLQYYSYRASLDPAKRPAMRQCLERAVERFPQYATAWALLSQIEIDEYRFKLLPDPSSDSSLARAQAAARRAVELDPQNVRGLQAEMFALYFKKEFEAALKVGEQALTINPNDTELMGEYGYRLALSGDWDRGCAFVERAHERNPNPAAYYESALALCAYMRGDYKSASIWIKKTPLRANPAYHLIAALIFAESGLAADAEAEGRWLMENVPDHLKDLRQWVASRVVRSQDIDRFVASFKKAGIPVAD